MIITVILLALACVFTAGYALTGRRLTKRFAQLNTNLANLLMSLNASAGQTTDSDTQVYNKELANQVAEAYNARAEMDGKLAEYQDNMIKLVCIIAIMAVIAVVAGFVL